MAMLTPQRCREMHLLLAVLLLLARPAAQAPPVADGLKADYYDGADFNRFVFSRRDATISFDWGHQPPAPGLSAEYFSVRWTGWLVPPASGRYIFHVTVDDGMRIWLNDRLILDEWRPQPVSYFAVAAELKAGVPYRLRVEYFQDILDTRAQLTWERVSATVAPPPSSWRNLWGMTTAAQPGPQPISTRYLYRTNPRPAPPVALAPAVVKHAPTPMPTRPAPPPPAVVRKARPAPVAAAKAAPEIRPQPTPVALPDTSGMARLARLTEGETVTLPELRFEQGQALLLPAARASLDSLAAALRTQARLRIEVQGHTDNVGNAELNRQLSQQRAETVCLYLMAHGVAAGQLRPVGYGGTQPVADNADPAQRPRNRRVVLRRL
jgi:outer membrane protein OmpA-like peptidoglycan-associated protein